MTIRVPNLENETLLNGGIMHNNENINPLSMQRLFFLEEYVRQRKPNCLSNKAKKAIAEAETIAIDQKFSELNLSLNDKKILNIMATKFNIRAENYDASYANDLASQNFYLAKEAAHDLLTISINTKEVYLAINPDDPEGFHRDRKYIKRDIKDILDKLKKADIEINNKLLDFDWFKFISGYVSAHNSTIINVTLTKQAIQYLRVISNKITTFNSKVFQIRERDSVGINGNIAYDMYMFCLVSHFTNPHNIKKNLNKKIQTKKLIEVLAKETKLLLPDAERGKNYNWKDDARRILIGIQRLKEIELLKDSSKFIHCYSVAPNAELDITCCDYNDFLNSYFEFDLIDALDERYTKRAIKNLKNGNKYRDRKARSKQNILDM